MPSSDTTFGWALVGPGAIARRFAAALKGVEGARLAAVASRDRARAAQFAREWGDEHSASGTLSAIGEVRGARYPFE